jgi:hypothetical protein
LIVSDWRKLPATPGRFGPADESSQVVANRAEWGGTNCTR